MTVNFIDPEQIIYRNQDIVFTDMDDEIVMMEMDSGNYYALDDVACDVWRLLENPINFADLCLKLSEQYDVEPQQCATDITPFLSGLSKQKVLIIE